MDYEDENNHQVSPLVVRDHNHHHQHHHNDQIINTQIKKKKKAGRKKFKETRHPVYNGVRKRNGEKWVCEVREPNKKTKIWLGTYPTPEMAARAHDVATLALRGTSALLNFPDSAFLLPLPASASPADIRTAATKAAHLSSSSSSTSSRVMKNSEFILKDCDDENIDNYDNNKSTLFLDEEALYNMPGLLDSMAEGLLLTPPSMTMNRAFDWDCNNVVASNSHDYGDDDDMDLTLWNHTY